MISTKLLRFAVIGAVLFPLASCLDLDVTNPNEPEQERALSNASDVEALIQSQFRTYWGAVQGGIADEGGTGPALDAAAEIEASNSANNGTWDMGMMPPEPVINQVGYRWGVWSRTSWLDMNRGLAAIRSGLISIEEQNLESQLPSPARVQAFAKFMQGLFHGYLALMYDQGIVLDETVEDPGEAELQPYDAVMQAARGYLQEARSIAQGSDFELPAGFLGPDSKTSDDLVRLSHSYEARFMTAVARSPEERAAVDWNQVLNHVDQGITEDFGINLDGPGGVWTSPYKSRSSRGNRIFLPLVGPADQSGAYMEWENTPARNRTPFQVETDDRRITDGTLTGEGKYIEYRASFINIRTRGNWFLSNYAPAYFRGISDTGFGFAPEITVEEMEFLAAEAHIQLGNPEAALPLINDERVEEGELPPATAEGVSGDRCVPRAIGPLTKASGLSAGECGDLMTTLIYEKRIELVQLSGGLSFFDARGWGILRTDRPIHIPIPMEDLQVLGLSHYTFGGGGMGSAP